MRCKQFRWKFHFRLLFHPRLSVPFSPGSVSSHVTSAVFVPPNLHPGPSTARQRFCRVEIDAGVASESGSPQGGNSAPLQFSNRTSPDGGLLRLELEAIIGQQTKNRTIADDSPVAGSLAKSCTLSYKADFADQQRRRAFVIGEDLTHAFRLGKIDSAY